MSRLPYAMCIIALDFGCNQDVGPQVDHVAVDKVYEQFAIAYRKADVSIVKEIYADTAIYLNPGEEIAHGQKEFVNNFGGMFDEARRDSSQLSIEFKIVNRRIAGDKVIDIGYYHFTREHPRKETNEVVGKFVTVL